MKSLIKWTIAVVLLSSCQQNSKSDKNNPNQPKESVQKNLSEEQYKIILDWNQKSLQSIVKDIILNDPTIDIKEIEENGDDFFQISCFKICTTQLTKEIL